MGLALRPVTKVDRDIPVPPAVVWRLLVEVDEWPRWGPSVRRAALADGGPRIHHGARGTVQTAVGVSLPFAITEFEPGRRWSWAVAGVPATGHEVSPVPGGCRVTFSTPWWASAYLTVCSVALARIDRLARSGQPQ